MADTKGFSHITVGTDDDDDVVIQAGIAEAAPEPAAAEAWKAGEAPLEFEPEPEPADDDSEAFDETGDVASEVGAAAAGHTAGSAAADGVRVPTATGEVPFEIERPGSEAEEPADPEQLDLF